MGAFAATVVVPLAVDLLSHRTAHVIRFKEAAAWSGLWVSLALIFGAVVFLVLGTSAGAGTEYTTAWLLEKSLSVDNLFVGPLNALARPFHAVPLRVIDNTPPFRRIEPKE